LVDQLVDKRARCAINTGDYAFAFEVYEKSALRRPFIAHFYSADTFHDVNFCYDIDSHVMVGFTSKMQERRHWDGAEHLFNAGLCLLAHYRPTFSCTKVNTKIEEYQRIFGFKGTPECVWLQKLTAISTSEECSAIAFECNTEKVSR
jgi:hypothetical protein